MQETANYGLRKPDLYDLYEVGDFNFNADKIDEELKKLDDNKVSKEKGKVLSDNNYTTEEKEKLAGVCILIFSNITVQQSAWGEDTTYTDYGYKASVPCAGVTADFFSDVAFDVDEAKSGNYAPVASTGDGIVDIYASEIPDGDITIQSIKCVKAVGA